MTDRISKIILRGDISGLKASMTAASSSVADVTKRMTASNKEAAKWRQGLSAVGDSAGKMGLVAAAGLGAIVLTTARFDKAMSAVQAATHESSDAMQTLREAAVKAGADTAFSASEAAQGIEELAKAGVDTKDILGGGLSGALDLAAAGALDVGQAAEIAATAMTQFKLDGAKVPHVADLLAAGAGKAQGSVQDMGMALAQSGLVASQTGLTIEETTGTLAAFASAGLIGSDSGTSFKTMLQSLTPTGEKAAAEMERLGISAYDAQGNFVGMTTFADSLRNGLKDLSVEQQNAAMKTIFGSDAVRAASVVFQQGGAGIQSWIDKVDDSGYAAQTAATRLDNLSGDLEALKGSLETALIGAGEGSTGPLRELVQGATDAINVFNKLPGPVKGTATAMLAVTAILGGGLWFTAKTIAGVAAMRANLAALGVTSGATATAMTALARSGAGLAAFWAGAAAGDKLGERNSKGIDKLSASLKDFAKTGKATGDLKDLFGDDLRGKAVRFGKDLGSIGDALKSLDGYADDNSLTEALKFFGSAGQSAGITAQAEALVDLDAALSKMATNKPDEAIATFEKLRDRALETGASAEDVARAFPEMAETLRAASQSMGGSSDATEVLTGNLTKLGPAAAEAASDVKAAQDALDKARESALATSLSFFDFSRDAKQSFGDYLNELEKSADAYANFTQNAIKASANGLDGGLIDKLKEEGPEGARALADFASASEKEVKRANAAFRDTSGLSVLQAELDLLPDDIVTNFKTAGSKGAIKTAVDVATEYKMSPKLVETILKAKDYTKADIKAVLASLAELDATSATPDIRVNTLDAEGKIRSLQQFINGMHGKTVRIAVEGGVGGGITTNATGGAIRGPGTGTSDSILSWVSNGEHVLTADEVAKAGGQGEIYRLRAAIRSGNMPAFANGGAVSTLDIKNQQRTVRDLEHSLREREKYGKKPKKGRDTRRTRNVLRGLDRQIAQLELGEAKQELADLRSGRANRQDAAAQRRDDAISTRDSVASGLSGGFGLGQFSGKNAFGQSTFGSGKDIASGAKAYAAKLRAFAAKIEKARKLGIPSTMLQEIGGLGVEEGTLALDALLSASSSDIATIKTAYRDIDTYAKSAGEVIAKALDLSTAGKDSAAGYAKGFINGLNGYADAMGKAANDAAKGKKSKASSKGKVTSASASFVQPPRQAVVAQAWGAAPVATTATIASSDMAAFATSVATAIASNPVALTALFKIGGRDAVALTDLSDQTKAKQS